MNPKVSVLITFYNQEKYVDKALQSVFDQVVDFDIEILVGDDGSTDGTQEIVKRWIDKYPGKIKMFVMERDGRKVIPGYRASRNRINLLKHVNGEYFNFLDGDDYFDDVNKLRLQVDVLENYDNADCIACAHNTDSLYADGTRKQNTPSSYVEGKYTAKKYWREMYFHTDSLLIRSSVIKELPLTDLDNNFNDNLITYSVIQHGSIYYLPRSMAVYLQTGDGIWTTGNRVSNLIRNLFAFDLCLKINPDMEKETLHRLGGNFFRIFQIRKQIRSDNLVLFNLEAKEKDLRNAYQWINYDKQTPWNKLRLDIDAFVKAILSKVY